MKKIRIALFGILSFLAISCSSDDRPIGLWDDNIELSQKEVTFNSSSNSITITTKGNNWWLVGIRLDKENIDLSTTDKFSKNFVVTNSEFQVERKEGKTIVITMNKNATNADRTLVITLEDGDYFDRIVVTQSK